VFNTANVAKGNCTVCEWSKNLYCVVVLLVIAPTSVTAAEEKKSSASATVTLKATASQKAKNKQVQRTVGSAIGGNKATPINRVKAAKGFKVELLYSVPGKEQGSWVNLCTDDKGRIIVSDQYGGLYRVSPPAVGEPVDSTTVEKVPADIRAVNGMVWAFGALYVGVNDYEQKISSGLYRITDSDGDDHLDKVELLRKVQSKSDHGVHALMPTPDGKALYMVTGNNAIPPKLATSSPVRRVWGEDHLLPSMPDGRNHLSSVSQRNEIRSLRVRFSQRLRRCRQSRWRTIHLRRRHGIRLQHALVSSDSNLSRD
jgi:hypothetical protein